VAATGRRRAVAIALWWVLAAAAAMCMLWTSWRLRRQTDFLDLHIYRNAIGFWMDGHPLYDFAQPGTRNRLGFTYPPFAALFLAPLAWVSQTQAEMLMLALNVSVCAVCGAGFAAALARRVGWPPAPVAVAGAAAVLSLEPIRESLGFGQINVLLLGMVALDIWLMSTGRRGGVAIGIAAAIKLTPLVLVLALFAAGRRDDGRRALLAAAAATGLGVAVLPDASWRYWTSEVWQTSRVGEPRRITNQSWSGVVARALEEATPPRLACLAGAAREQQREGDGRRRATGPWALTRVLAAAGAASSFASPISWTHHYWWAVPALAALALRAAAARSPLAIAVAAAVYGAFVVGPIELEQALHGRAWLGHGASDLYLYAALVACAGLVRQPHLRRGRPAPAAQVGERPRRAAHPPEALDDDRGLEHEGAAR
jgi:alpha-1,2-mannosyltransferase